MTRPPIRTRSYVLVYLFLAAAMLLAHAPFLHLPYYWDEIGQFVPASLDLYESGSWIPHSTLPNVHPPAVMAYVALTWQAFGTGIEITRGAMLLLAAFGALGAFLLTIEISRGLPGTPAFVALALLSISPLFYSQSMMVLLDMPAMALTAFALLLFLQNRFRACAAVCVVLAMVKETGIVAPALFGVWLLWERRGIHRGWTDALWFLLPLPALGGWLFALHQATGHWLGNAEFTRYNVWYPLHPVRLSLALVRRIYYLFVADGHFLGAAALAYAWRRVGQFHSREWRVCSAFLIAHTVAVCLLGGAVLERYLLPVLPILYAAFAISIGVLPRRPRIAVLVALPVALIASNVLNPPYPFPFENNLAWTTYVGLEQQVAYRLGANPLAEVATAFPLTDALRRRDFGFVDRKHRVRQLASFRKSDLAPLVANPPDILVTFTQTWDPLHLLGASKLGGFLQTYYGYEPEATTSEIERMLGMKSRRVWESRGFEFTLFESQ